MPVPVILDHAVAVQVQVPSAVVVMAVEVPSLAVEFPRKTATQDDQHERHSGFGHRLELGGKMQARREDDRSNRHERRRVADAPPKSDGAGGPKRRPFGQHRRDRSQMVGVEGMPEAEQKSHAQRGEQFGVRHGHHREP